MDQIKFFPPPNTRNVEVLSRSHPEDYRNDVFNFFLLLLVKFPFITDVFCEERVNMFNFISKLLIISLKKQMLMYAILSLCTSVVTFSK